MALNDWSSYPAAATNLVSTWFSAFRAPISTYASMLSLTTKEGFTQTRITRAMGLLGVSLVLYILVTAPLNLSLGIRIDDLNLIIPNMTVQIAMVVLLGVSLHFSLRAVRIPSNFATTFSAYALTMALLIPPLALASYSGLLQQRDLVVFAKTHSSVQYVPALVQLWKISIKPDPVRFELAQLVFLFVALSGAVQLGLLSRLLQFAYGATLRKIGIAIAISVAISLVPIYALGMVRDWITYSYAQLH